MPRIFNQDVSLKSVFLMMTEGTLIVLSLVAAVKLRFWGDQSAFEFHTLLPDFAFQVLVAVVTFQICFYYNDLYDLRSVLQRAERFVRIGESLGASCLVLAALYYVAPALVLGRGVFLLALILVASWAILARITLDAAWYPTDLVKRVLIVGTGPLAVGVAREFARREDLHVNLVGFVAGSGAADDPGMDLLLRPTLGSIRELEALTWEHNVSEIVVALEDYRGALPVGDLVKLRVQGVRVEDAHTTLAALTGRVWLESVRPSWFVFSDGFRRSRLNGLLKRAVDLSFALLGLALSAPLMAIIALAIRLDSRGPALYRQERVGLHGRVFDVLKFRSMVQEAEGRTGPQWAQKNDPRVTRIGGFLRKYRLDELPQFLNVLQGQMSFVGPRPERPAFVELLRQKIPFYDERHSARPGITGWAQVRYDYAASVEGAVRKLEYDLFYLKNMSVLLDCLIVFETVRIVLEGKGGR